MGKSNYKSEQRITAKAVPRIAKRAGKENRPSCSSDAHLAREVELRESNIISNVKKALRIFSARGREDNKKRLKSALNIASEKEIICSAMNIPSIENMIISRNDLCSYNQCDDCFSESAISFHETPSYCLLENEPELMLSYAYLVEKALNKLGILLSPQQNEKLIMGVWNILVKYWADDCGDLQYSNLNAKIEWGILELLNFDLKVTRKDRILMEAKIKQLPEP